MTEIKILACQIDIPRTRSAAERDAHLAALGEKIKAHAERGQFDLIVLPELSSIEYSKEAFKRLKDLEEPLAGPSYDLFSDLARQLETAISFGFPHRAARGRHISQGIMGPDGGLLGRYDKLHIAQFGDSAEAAHFKPGDSLLTVEIAGFRIAPIICYDIRFPGLSERLRAAGVDIVIQSGAYARDFSFHSWHDFVRTRAIETQMAWLGLNRAGPGWGGSIWVPDGTAPDATRVFGDAETFWPLTLTREALDAARERMPLATDRRGDYATMKIKHSKSE
ncbi:carbon-nitrogen hydrolase family protein [Rhodobacteraceae bacterium NNCM2]|nr:carbon-nitrogen hydrolase family protein [Coraliihabitans acroporae]